MRLAGGDRVGCGSSLVHFISENIQTCVRVFDVFLARTWVSLSTIGSVSVPTTRTQRGRRVDLVCAGVACGDHLDLGFAIIYGPVLASCTDNFDLLEEVSLVPTESDLSNLVFLVEVYEMDLKWSAYSPCSVERTYHWKCDCSVNNKSILAWQIGTPTGDEL